MSLSNLSPAQIDVNLVATDPYRTIERFFEMARLDEIKQMLADIRQHLVNRSYPYSPASIEHENTIYFFERLDQLIEATAYQVW